MGPSFSIVQSVIHPGLRGLASGGLVIVQNLLGIAVGPVLTGALSDRYDIQTAMALVAFVPLISAVLFAIGAVFYDRDLANTERVVLTME